MLLSELNIGEKAYILRINGSLEFKRHLGELGFIKGKEIVLVREAPLGDPCVYRLMNSEVLLRKSEASLIEVVSEKEIIEEVYKEKTFYESKIDLNKYIEKNIKSKLFTVKVALVGNPNTGKTSFFNYCTKLKEYVANYSGATVDLKKGKYNLNNYLFEVIDLPGTYSLNSLTSEGSFVRNFLLNENYDIIINIVDVTNLERNLYLTTQLLEMEIPMVVSLNMYDELIRRGDKINSKKLSDIIGVPCIPTVSSRGRGIVNVFREIIKIVENNKAEYKHVFVNYGKQIESAISNIQSLLRNTELKNKLSTRYLSIALLENDVEIKKIITQNNNSEAILQQVEVERQVLKQGLLNVEEEIVNKRYSFISDIISNVYKLSEINKRIEITKKIDNIVTHKFFGIPIFIALLWLIFQGTFILGKYPVDAIKYLTEYISEYCKTHIENYFLKEALVNGIITGLSNVMAYLPNIIILFLFLSILEDVGYLPRVIFIMDKIMRKINLQGKSFIPIFLGFGCTVPAIMATRSIENKTDRLVTILVTPFISCSARLPVLILLISALYNENQGTILFLTYLISILITGLMSILLKKIFFKTQEVPIIIELPPYRIPTLKNLFYHLWYKIYQYIKRMAFIIFCVSIVVWALQFFPYNKELNAKIVQLEKEILTEKNAEKLSEYKILYENLNRQKIESSLLTQCGKIISPVFTPLGFDWRISVSLLTGIIGKETILSTMAILFANNNSNNLSNIIKTDTLFTKQTILSLIIFILLYTPCIGTLITMYKETGRIKYSIISFIMNFSVAWFMAYLARLIVS
ncbi:MAG: ferrous iron transport protein B [Bacteroidales bacterium]|nr:ferrous iron transport protein B [Bacteroidales bacterium]